MGPLVSDADALAGVWAGGSETDVDSVVDQALAPCVELAETAIAGVELADDVHQVDISSGDRPTDRRRSDGAKKRRHRSATRRRRVRRRRPRTPKSAMSGPSGTSVGSRTICRRFSAFFNVDRGRRRRRRTSPSGDPSGWSMIPPPMPGPPAGCRRCRSCWLARRRLRPVEPLRVLPKRRTVLAGDLEVAGIGCPMIALVGVPMRRCSR